MPKFSKKLKKNNGKYKKKNTKRFNMENENQTNVPIGLTMDDTGATDEVPMSTQTMMGDAYFTQRSQYNRSRINPELLRLRQEQQQMEAINERIANETYEGQYGEEFSRMRRGDMRQLAYDQEMRQSPRSRGEHIFRLIYNNDIYGVQSLLQSDVYIARCINTIYVSGNGANANTFLSYAIRENKPEIVKMLLISGAYVEPEYINLTSNIRIIRMLQIYTNENLSIMQKRRMVDSAVPTGEGGINSVEEWRAMRRQRQQMINLNNQLGQMNINQNMNVPPPPQDPVQDLGVQLGQMNVNQNDPVQDVGEQLGQMNIDDALTRDDILDMKVTELKDELGRVGLRKSGNKPALRKRLFDHYGV